MKKKFVLIVAVIAAFVISVASVAGCSDKVEWIEEVPSTFINETLNFDLSPDVDMPTPDASSARGTDIEELVTLYAQSYENDEYLKEDVKLFRQWQWEALYNSLAQKAKDNPRWLNTYRLQAEVYLIKSQYAAALAALDKVLFYNHDDVYALGLSALVQNIQGNSAQRDARLAALKKVSETCYNDLYDLMVKITGWIQEEHGTEMLDGSALPYDAIGVLGVSPTPTGELQGSGPIRVKDAIKAAYYCSSKPKIIVSGGAIDTEYSEASVMGNYIVRNSDTIAKSMGLIGEDEHYFIYGDDVLWDEQARDTIGNAIGICDIMAEQNLHNVLIIASQNQVMRAECIFKAYIEAKGYDITVTSHISGGEAPSANQTKYSYICAASAYGLFTKDDFENHSRLPVETSNAFTMPKGIVKVDKPLARAGETVTYSAVAASGYEVDTVTVKTLSGNDVAVNNGTFKMPDEKVIINAAFKRVEGTVTLNFFNGETFGTNQNGITNVANALKACEDNIKAVSNGIVSATDTIKDDQLMSGASNALGYGKMGGFGLAAGGRIGGFKLNFKEDYKISKIQVTAVKFAENEGHLQVNGIDPTSGTLQGEANVFDASYVEYVFDTPTNVLDFRTVSDNVDGVVNYGRVIIYSITLFLEDTSKIDIHSINIEDTANGTVTASRYEAIEGTEITLSAKGDAHYFLDKYTVKQGDTEIPVTDGKFIMPAGDVTVTATFVNRLEAETKIVVDSNKIYNTQIVGSVTLNKDSYSSGDKATIMVKTGEGFVLDSLSVTTVGGQKITVANDNTFTFPDDDVIVTATYKEKANTITIDFFNEEYFGTSTWATVKVDEIQTYYQALLDEFFGTGFVKVSNVTAAGGAKYGGFGIGSGSAGGSFTLTFADSSKISKVVINGAKNKAGEGLITVNGESMGEQTFSATNGGAGGEISLDSNVTFDLSTNPTNEVAVAGVAKATGRTIIYSITIYLAE